MMRAPAATVRYELFYGQASTPLVRAEPDRTYPDLWRIVWPDGRVSDIVNLTRAKDAAMALSERGPPARNPQRLHWRLNRSDSPSAGRTCVESAGPALRRGRPEIVDEEEGRDARLA
jgi:hypothetical protein